MYLPLVCWVSVVCVCLILWFCEVNIVCVCLWFVASLLCVSVSGLWRYYSVCLSLVCGVITVCVCLWFVGSYYAHCICLCAVCLMQPVVLWVSRLHV